MDKHTEPLTLQQAQNEWAEGGLCALVEYRSSRCEAITWMDKDTERTKHAIALTHTVENKDGAMLVNERVEGKWETKAQAQDDADKYQSPFKKGSKVLARFRVVSSQKGATVLYGTLTPVLLNGETKK